MMFPYSPSHAAHFLFGGAGNNIATQNDTKKKTEFIKLLDISDYFFISHPVSGQKEGQEHERLMFFSPSSQSISKQTEITGMAEAIVNFSSISFRQDTVPIQQTENSYRYVTSSNSKEVILVVEKGAFILGISLCRKSCREYDYTLHSPTIKTLLERAYHAYKLFFGPFEILFNYDKHFFKSNLERFFTPYLQLLRVNKTPLVDLFSGVDFLPLESLHFLEVHCLMVGCIEEFPCIKKTMFLYQERLIQYDVDKADLIPIWSFLNQTLIPSAMQAELSPDSRRANNHGSGRTGFFVNGSIIVDFLGELSPKEFPKVFILDEDGTYAAYDLVAYRVLNATACFFVPSAENQPSTSFLEQLCNIIDSPMATIASKIGDKFLTEVRPYPPDIQYQFIYFNPDSLSLRRSFPTSVMSAHNISAEPQILPTNMHRLIYETYDKFITDSSMLGQIYLRTENDWWIVLKRVERRILALFLPQNAATTIVEIQNCVDTIVKTRFPNLFIS